MKITEILSFAVGVAGVAAALVTWWITERRNREAPYHARLAEFLLPLQGNFDQTAIIIDDLRGDLFDLEFASLKYYFEGLPDSDPRKFWWRQRINRLHMLNSDSIQLIAKKEGESSPELHEALKRFRAHAMAWEDMWKAVDTGRVPANKEVRGPQFPKQVKEALNKEIEETRRRIGKQ